MKISLVVYACIGILCKPVLSVAFRLENLHLWFLEWEHFFHLNDLIFFRKPCLFLLFGQ